jgi:hypothetical protein
MRWMMLRLYLFLGRAYWEMLFRVMLVMRTRIKLAMILKILKEGGLGKNGGSS